MEFQCPHCSAPISVSREFDKIVENGNAYSQTCSNCLHTVGIRPHLDTDPAAPSEVFTDQEVGKMRFVQWRLENDILLQTEQNDYIETQSVADQINAVVERATTV